jgi:hypothetical protein
MKQQVKRNFRIEVTPEEPLFPDDRNVEGWLAKCQDMQDNILRHVDGIENIDILYDDLEICEFCTAEWEEDETGMPEC